MSNQPMSELLTRARVCVQGAELREQSDSDLLAEFCEQADQAAFAVMVERHANLVWGVCRRLLRHHQDAEDAFQATFLLLAQKSESVQWQSSVGGWLARVAFQVARNVRRTKVRRFQRESRVAVPDEAALERPCADEEAIRDEVLRLPDRYRLPLVLCYWEGMTQPEAASELGWSEGTLRGRLNRGRDRLRQRLAQLGFGSTFFVPLPSPVVHQLKESVAHAGWLLRCGQTPIEWVSSAALTLMRGVSNAMLFTELRRFSLFLLPALFALVPLAVPSPAQPPSDPIVPEVETASAVEEQAEEWTDLVTLLDPDRDTVGQGIWRLKDGKLIGYPAAHGARIRIPLIATGNYELRARWEPKTDGSCVHFIMPHGDRFVTFEVLSYFHCAGMGDLNGVRPDTNETTKKLDIKGGKVYDVSVKVTYTDRQFHMLAKLDDKVIVDWEGKRSEVDHEFFAPPKPASFGLAVSGQASTFHSIEVKPISGELRNWGSK